MEIEAARAVWRIVVKRGASWNQASRVWCWRVVVVRMGGGEEHDCCGEVGCYCHCGAEGFGVGEGDGLCGRCGRGGALEVEVDAKGEDPAGAETIPEEGPEGGPGSLVSVVLYVYLRWLLGGGINGTYNSREMDLGFGVRNVWSMNQRMAVCRVPTTSM